MQGLPRQVKGSEFRAWSCRSLCVRIVPLALTFWDIGKAKKAYATE